MTVDCCTCIGLLADNPFKYKKNRSENKFEKTYYFSITLVYIINSYSVLCDKATLRHNYGVRVKFENMLTQKLTPIDSRVAR